MNRIRKTLAFSVLALVALATTFATTLTAQTNPTPQALPYIYNFSSLPHTSNEYPAGWQGWDQGNYSNVFATTNPTADADLNPGRAAQHSNKGTHNYDGKIGLLAGPGASGNYSLCLALNTTGFTDIYLDFDIMTIRNPYGQGPSNRICYVDVQYRVGPNEPWISLSGDPNGIYHNNTTTQVGADVTTPQNLEHKHILLPDACENQSAVYIRWIVRDGTGDHSRPSFAINYFNVGCLPAAVTCPDNIETDNDAGTCGAAVEYSPTIVGNPEPEVSYVFTGATTGSGSGTGSGSTFNVGTSTVTITAMNDCATDVCSFTVTVNDAEAPTLTGTIPGEDMGNVCMSGAPEAPAEADIAALYTDNCSGEITATLTGSTVEGTDCNWTATYTYSITDGNGNAAEDAVVVYTGGDTEDPTITAPENIELCFEDAEGGCAVDLGMPTAWDNCSFEVTNDAPECFEVGTTTVTWTVTDGCGHTATATQTVRRNAEIIVGICAGPSRRIVRGTHLGKGPYGHQTVQLSSSVSGGTPGYSYSWSPSAGLSSTTISNPVANPSATTQYCLTVTDSEGCTKTQCITVEVVTLSSIVCGNAPANQGGFKVNVCHIPPGNPNNPQSICISVNALAAHLTGSGQGHENCYLGTCLDNCTSGNSGKQATNEGDDDHHFGEGVSANGNVVNVYPNPAQNLATFRFMLGNDSYSRLELCDFSGRVVSVVHDGAVKGNDELYVEFNTANLPTGVYFYRLHTPMEVLSGKLTLIKE